MKYENMNKDELIKQVSELEHKKIVEAKKVYEINKKFNDIDTELQKAKAELYNKNIEQRYQTKIC